MGNEKQKEKIKMKWNIICKLGSWRDFLCLFFSSNFNKNKEVRLCNLMVFQRQQLLVM